MYGHSSRFQRYSIRTKMRKFRDTPHILRSVSRCLSVHTSGPQGVDRRIPSFDHSDSDSTSTLVSTDPFQLYMSYVASGLMIKDEAQLRAMKEFQKLYHRVIDYTPPQEIAIRTSILMKKLELQHAEEVSQVNSQVEPLHRLRSWFKKDIETKKKDLIRYLTDEEELANIAAPQGLLVNGEVGCGKSMLMDIFASTLPYKSKMRWHYNNFILWVYEEIHRIQKEKMLTLSVSGKHKMTIENEFILFEIAQKMISRSTVFMLDEFMLPDVASAQIVRILFTYYFKLGGVLIATSNKLPEELYSSEFNKSRFKSFVGILNTRCVAVDMRSSIDYRAQFALDSVVSPNLVVQENNMNHDIEWLDLVKRRALQIEPHSYLHDPRISISDLPSKRSTFTVYNRTSTLDTTFKDNSVCYVTFDYICKGLFSSSDYITLASIYHTVIIDSVPVMTRKMKNEARRFITLLDALYEARCQLYLRTEAPVEKLFFPEGKKETDTASVQEEEMFAKTAIAASNPYRPNVASYDTDHAKEYETKNPKDVNFGDVKAFTGEDEKFAYKRAVSRIREMVESDRWRKSNQWVPVHQRLRPWGSRSDQGEVKKLNKEEKEEDVKLNMSRQEIKSILQDNLPRDVGQQYNMTFRQFNQKVAPAFSSLQHFWSMGEWTAEQHQKIKDKIARRWVGSSMKKPESK
ncbi:putative ATPase [Clavispora lusitaniae]|uniref:ATPase n=1 Tax=Clavispora lusitaniae TaxID=36911 RepID=A0ACD0WEC3_CLALS|nr:putative ATPase [Clavispora lusitaniae]QFZ30961.1 putative ATPase [Clavispora lusitaniae]QFZ36629.1 putative ATPase [Clavispora lusitaniae]QFZ42313.1 putative ATPase [Clavispora lusitaniae]QFZ47989.1 putative ATPase [Clavispora lusitaniae]